MVSVAQGAALSRSGNVVGGPSDAFEPRSDNASDGGARLAIIMSIDESNGHAAE
jgi:hypothetical protein